jgi:hypothetical protein
VLNDGLNGQAGGREKKEWKNARRVWDERGGEEWRRRCVTRKMYNPEPKACKARLSTV